MITKEINLIGITNNGDGTQSMIAELNVYKDGVLAWQDSRSPFMCNDDMTEQDIKDWLWANDYSKYL